MLVRTRETPVGLLGSWRTACRTCQLPEGRTPDPISRWLVVTRACVQPMTLTAAAIAGLLAAPSPAFDLGYYLLAGLGIVIAHASNNMINDYFDLQEGQDTSSYPRALYAPHPVLSGLVTRAQLGTAIIVANLLDAAIMLVLFFERGWPILAFALAGLFISVGYVAPPLRLKARGLGEPSVFLIWGPLMVAGTFYSATGFLPTEVWLASIPYALLVTSVLMGKHLDKAPWDEPQDMRTLPVVLGEGAARRTTQVLMVGFYAVVAGLVVAEVVSVWTLLVVAALPRLIKALRTYERPRPEEPPERYPLWPLWFVSWAFVHARRAGALFVLGLLLGNVLT